MDKFTLVLIFFFCQSVFSQNDTIYLLVKNPVLQYGCEQRLNFGFSIKSKDSLFISDYFEFSIPNIKGFNSETTNDYIYYTAEELRREVEIDTLKYETIHTFTRNKKPWEIHKSLSLKKLYLLEKKIDKNGTANYYLLPLKYTGTQKNVIQTDY